MINYKFITSKDENYDGNKTKPNEFFSFYTSFNINRFLTCIANNKRYYSTFITCCTLFS